MARGPTVFDAATFTHKIAATIADPTGGTGADATLRTAVNFVLAVLRFRGVVAGAGTKSTPQIDTDFTYVAGAAIADLSLATGDIPTRTALNSVLAAMRSAGLIGRGAAARAQPGHDPTDFVRVNGPAIADPTGGIADTAARPAVISILAALRNAGVIGL